LAEELKKNEFSYRERIPIILLPPFSRAVDVYLRFLRIYAVMSRTNKINDRKLEVAGNSIGTNSTHADNSVFRGVIINMNSTSNRGNNNARKVEDNLSNESSFVTRIISSANNVLKGHSKNRIVPMADGNSARTKLERSERSSPMSSIRRVGEWFNRASTQSTAVSGVGEKCKLMKKKHNFS